MTLIEIMVTLGIMSVVMALVTAAVGQMYRSSNLSESLSIQVAQLQTAFQRLDREVRYAVALSEPNATATPAGNWYVEWATIAEGVTSCTQVRLEGASGLLVRRTRQGARPIGDWATIASYLSGTHPFDRRKAAAAAYPYQQLTVGLKVQVGPVGAQASRAAMFTFTALNTTLETPDTGVCADMDRP